MMDVIDKKLLNIVQTDFPIDVAPYQKLGEMVGISEEEVIFRLHQLKDNNIIRRLGGVFDSRKLGYKGTLCALKVPTDRIDEVAKVVNRYPGITHNYLRDHPYNMWFTILAESPEQVAKVLLEICEETGIKETLNLPAERFFKLKVNFKLAEANE
jgi:DNA-binding Lrp family transcriptional regulator